MPETMAIPEPVRGAVSAAFAEIERRAPGYLLAAGPFRIDTVAVRPRAHSTTTIIRLSGSGRQRRFYLKTLKADPTNWVLKRSQIISEHRVLEEVSLHVQSYAGLAAIAPVACWPDLLSALTEEFPGETLDVAISRARGLATSRTADRVTELCRLVGRWLRLFQAWTKPVDGAPFDAKALLDYCERRLVLLREASRSRVDGGFSRAVTEHVRRLALDIGPGDLACVGAQNDFRPENILTDGARIGVLDFTGFAYGPPLADFMKFWMKLEDLKFGPLFHARRVANWQAAYRDGYGHRIDLSTPLCRLLRIANTLDKMSECVTNETVRLGRRFLMARWYTAQRRWLRQVVDGTMQEWQTRIVSRSAGRWSCSLEASHFRRPSPAKREPTGRASGA